MSDALGAVIFDLDGVLVDSEPVHWRASQRLFAPHHLAEAEYARFIGVAVEPYMEWARERFGLDDAADRLVERYEEAVTAEIEAAALPPLDGARELIEASRARGLRVAVGSQSIAAWVKATLRSAALDGLFDAVVSGDEVERGKPAPDVYLLAAERLGVAPERCVAIEDSPAGLQSAAAAGMLGVQSRQASSAAEPQPLAQLVVGSLREVDLGRLSCHRRCCPTVAGPSLTLPTVAGPSLTLPTVAGPSLTLPTVAGPSLTLPTVAGPSLTLPTVAGPSLTLPTVAGGCSHVGRLVSLPAPRVHARLG